MTGARAARARVRAVTVSFGDASSAASAATDDAVAVGNCGRNRPREDVAEKRGGAGALFSPTDRGPFLFSPTACCRRLLRRVISCTAARSRAYFARRARRHFLRAFLPPAALFPGALALPILAGCKGSLRLPSQTVYDNKRDGSSDPFPVAMRRGRCAMPASVARPKTRGRERELDGPQRVGARRRPSREVRVPNAKQAAGEGRRGENASPFSCDAKMRKNERIKRAPRCSPTSPPAAPC